MGDETTKVTPGQIYLFFVKYKNYIWPAVLFIVGLLGGNADRVAAVLPTDQALLNRVTEVEKRVLTLEVKVYGDNGASVDVDVETPVVRVK